MSDPPQLPLPVHSLAEAYLYLMANVCGECARGPLTGSDARTVEAEQAPRPDQGEARRWRIGVTCSACHAESTLTCMVPDSYDLDGATSHPAAKVNPTDEPSKVLDVGQWIVLFRMITEAASRETDKVQARHLGLEAAQCLDEALKFYNDPENDLPPPEAVFHDATRERLQKAPEQFSRQRLLDLRAKLPTESVMRARLGSGERQPWWKRRREDRR